LFARRSDKEVGTVLAILPRSAAVPGETQMHKTLKKEACRWMHRNGYRCIAAEVRLPPVGIIDAVGTGYFRPYHNYLSVPTTLPQTIFIECKASRSDFLRDKAPDKQLTLCLKQKKRDRQRGVPNAHRKIRGQDQLGKFATCMLLPTANLHYVMAPAGLLKKSDLPPRWGLLTLGEGGVAVTVRADWVESRRINYVEAAIARTLTGDIYRADQRAISSVNREIMTQQHQLAERLRALTPALTEQIAGTAEKVTPKVPAALERAPAGNILKKRTTKRRRARVA
jgi:hypothetical protein